MSEDQFSERLAEVAQKRGYLLPHHGLLAISGNGLLEAYDALYSAINFSERTLSRHDHEFVWLVVLITCREVIGTHHIQRFKDTGGTDEEIANALAMTAFAGNATCYDFVSENWSGHLPDFDVGNEYMKGFKAAAGSTQNRLAHLAAAAIHTCTGNQPAFSLHIAAAYEAQADELALAESLSLAMFPAGVPNYVWAAGVWQQMILSGQVAASQLFTTWAKTSGQGGFDEASGVRK